MRFAVSEDSLRLTCRIYSLFKFLKMFELFFALFMAFSCPAHNDNTNNGTVTTQSDPPAEGDNGYIPPKPPKPPVPTQP